MPNPVTPQNPKSAGGSRAPEAKAPSTTLLLTEDRLQRFWEKYSGVVTAACFAVALGIVAKYGWEYYQGQREAAVQQDYAAAATVDQLKKFVLDHPNHALTPIAQLRLADAAYMAGRIAEARDDYAQVSNALSSGPFGARAQLGLGITQVLSGETAEGEATLKRLADDSSQFQAARAEAIYQLASLAAATGRADEVQKYATQLFQVDPSSPWTERIFVLQAGLAAKSGGKPGFSNGK
jgi:hypothetical protein